MTKSRAILSTLILGTIAVLITLISPAIYTYGATIATTSASDSLTTFRLNTNLSLESLNTDKLELSDLAALNLFSTTSTDYWQTQRNFFSTTSAEYWKSLTNFFSTTSADYWGSTKGYATFGYLFPTNSTSTALTFSNGINVGSTGIVIDNADTGSGLTIQTTSAPGSWTATFPALTGAVTLGTGASQRVALWSGTNTLSSDTLTFDGSTLNVGNGMNPDGLTVFGHTSVQTASSTILSAGTLCLTGDTCISSWPSGGSSFAYPFPANATSTVIDFSGGFTAASTTISGTTTTARLNVTEAVSILGEYFTNFTTYVRSLFSAGTGLSYSTGQFSINQAANLTWTGTHDFGGGVLEIPNGSGPTVDAAGETAVDTTTDQYVYFGGAKRVLHYEDDKSFVVATSTLAYMGSFAASGTTTLAVWNPKRATTITDFYCKEFNGVGTSTVRIGNGSASSTYAVAGNHAAASIGSLSIAVTARSNVYVEFGTLLGAPGYWSCTITSVYTAD